MSFICIFGSICNADSWVELTYDDFEAGWGSYTDGGLNCFIYESGTHAVGTNSVDIQGGDPLGFFTHTNGIDVHSVGYTQIKVDFWFKMVGMEIGEGFWVQYYNGSGWQNIGTFTCGSGYNNDTAYTNTIITLNEGTYNFPTNMKIRFKCNASSSGDDVYIDEIIVSGFGGVADSTPPMPNPATFSMAPTAASASSISMTATTGSDVSGPVEYSFVETSGNPGASSSGWITSNTYIDDGLSEGTTYTYTVQMRDNSVTGTNTGTASSGFSATTLVMVPDVTSLAQATAEANVTSAGLAVGSITRSFSNTTAVGSVISQVPAGGTELTLGSTVNLNVSKGIPGADFEDLVVFAANWLDTGCGICNDQDYSGDNDVDFQDFAHFAQKWQLEPPKTLVINEFMASNDSTIADDFGEYDDWIEIYNYGQEVVIMDGMFLADSTYTYPIPYGVSIAAGQHLIFWADKDKSPDQGPLHTNFKLGADGDEITLYDTDGTTLIDSITYRAEQTTDISHGRYPDNTPNWYNMDDPTPGATNTAGMAGEVWFSKLSGTFTSSFNLELSTESPTAEIRYTNNGWIPTAASTLYTGPISISTSAAARIRARAFEPAAGLAPGPVAGHYYTPLASDVQSFSSNLPIIIIDTYGANMEHWFRITSAVFIDVDPVTGIAGMQDIPDQAGRAGLKLRGESSDAWPKKHYGLELWDENNIDTKVSLFGMPSESDWTLNNPYGDKTLIRNVLTYKWANDIGQGFAAPGTKLVEIFVNEGGDNCSYSDYRGVYVLTEKIKVSSNRLDIGNLEPLDNTEPEITGGYILRLDKDYDNEYEEFRTIANMVTNSDGQGFQYFDPDQFTLTSTQKDWILNHFNEYESVLNSGTFYDPVNGYAKYIDVESFIESDIIAELFKEADGFRYSTYLYKEKNGKIGFGPEWDYNFSSGNATNPSWYYPEYYARADTSEGWYNYYRNSYGWHRQLLQDPDYMLRTADKWFEHREDKLSDDQVTADIDYYYTLLDSDGPSVNTGNTPADRNFAKWNILNTYQWCNYYYGYNPSRTEQGYLPHTYKMETEWLKNWFNGQGTPAAGEWYLATHSDRLRHLDALWASNRNIDSPPALLINSIPMNTGGSIAVGSSLVMDPNSISDTIYYTTDGTDPREWTHWGPFTRTLVAENASKKALVPSSSISENWKGGGAFDDSSWTSTTDGVGYDTGTSYDQYIGYDVESLMHGTGLNNTCYIRTQFTVDSADLPYIDTLKLRIRFDDAFVAYINGTEVARSSLAAATPAWDSNATGYTDPETDALVEFDITAYISELIAGSGNILAIHGMNSGNTSSDFLISFELEVSLPGAPGSGSGELLVGGSVSPTALTYSSPFTLNDSTQIKVRAKDGSGNWSALNEAIFSMNNVAPSLRITEVMYHPVDPNDEFIEFKNIGASTINLAHCQLTQGVDFTFPSVVLAPNAYTIVVRNTAEFNARYPGYSGSIAGEYTNDQLDNGGEKIRLKDAVGVIIQEFDYEDGWFPITDGEGFSLNIINPADANLDNWNKRLSWQASNVSGGTPGTAHAANTIGNADIVINEILTNTDDSDGDWIEIYNASAGSIDVGNWYLSDDKDNLKKYRIASPTNIPSGGYLVLTAAANFQNDGDSGSAVQFGLSEHGEDVFLTSGNGTDIAGGYSAGESFGSSREDVTFGRYTKGAPTYNTDFIELILMTQGTANSAPYVPDVVMTEIMYNAQDLPDLLGEYIELHNRDTGTVYLYDPANPENTWTFTKGVDFTFPTGVSIGSGQKILISRTHPDAFKAANGDPGVTVYGPFESDTELANDGEKIELSMPTKPDPETGFISYIRVEQVNYSDGIHPLVDDPWPTSADGRGDSLHRTTLSDYANDVANWSAAAPTPGS